MDKKDMLQAVMNCDKMYDGKFFYGVKSTGIFCRPSCKSRNPSPDNVVFFETGQQAMQAGFRPCKRCRPDLLFYCPEKELATAAAEVISTCYGDKLLMNNRLSALPVTRRHLTKLFENHYGVSIAQYAAETRLKKACELLKNNVSVTDAAMQTGFETPSAFSVFFKKQLGISPAEYSRKVLEKDRWCYYNTPVGTVKITEDDIGITSLQFVENEEKQSSSSGLFLSQACQQLEEYFTGRRKSFALPLSLNGTDFQQNVWGILTEIPYGQTKSYLQIAAMTGNPKAARAVGNANNRNPILIIIPCHRVVGKDNRLVGYAGGIQRKQFLLEMERKFNV